MSSPFPLGTDDDRLIGLFNMRVDDDGSTRPDAQAPRWLVQVKRYRRWQKQCAAMLSSAMTEQSVPTIHIHVPFGKALPINTKW